jgi:hypothetical protein
MITSLLKKSTPLNFSGSNFNTERFFSLSNSGFGLDRFGLIDYSKVGLLFVLLGSVFLTNFISTKMD